MAASRRGVQAGVLAALMVTALATGPSASRAGEEAGPRECLAAADVEDLVACLEDWMPPRDSEGYQQPSAHQLEAFQRTARALAELPCRVLEPLGGLSEHYDVAGFHDEAANRSYCVLLETRDGDGDGTVDLGWGTLLVDQEADRGLHLQVPHPLFDIDTPEQAAGIVPHVEAASLLVAGSHRYANAPEGERAPPADVAHRRDTPFHRAVLALGNHEQQPPGLGAFVQLHGMASDSCPDVDVYLTNGTEIPPAPEGPLDRLQAALQDERADWTVTVPGQEPGCHLGGTQNVQGQALRERGQSFVHVESEREDRLAQPWIGALSDVQLSG